MVRRQTGVVYLLLIVACAFARPDGTPPGLARLRVLPLGDSITQGMPTEDGYRGFLRRELEATGIRPEYLGTQESAAGRHEGWVGYTAEEMLPRVDAALGTGEPDVVLLHIGTNDIGLGADGAETARRTERLLERIHRQRRGPLVLVAQIIPMSQAGAHFEAEVRRLNGLLPGVVAARRRAGQRVELVDMHTGFDPARDLADALHPSADGYRKLAKRWADAIRAAGAAPGSGGPGRPAESERRP